MASSSKDVIKMINHYKKSLEVPDVDEKRILHCIGVLYKLGVTLHTLQETGIGRTVNGLCKSEATEVRQAAKSLVNKWKALVLVNEGGSDGEPAAGRHSQEEDTAHHKVPEQPPSRKERSHHHHHHRSSKHQREEEEKHSHHRERAAEKAAAAAVESSLTNGGKEAAVVEKPKSHHHRHHRSSDKKESKKRSAEEQSSSSSSRDRSSKRHRPEKRDEPEEDVEIDGSAGTSFADALAMMDGGGGGGGSTKTPKPSHSSKASSSSSSATQSNGNRGGGDSTLSKTKVTSLTSSSSKSLTSQSMATPSSSKSTSSSHISQQSKRGGIASSSRPSDTVSGPPRLLAPSTKLAPLLDPEELKRDILGPSVVISNSYTPTSYNLNPVNIAGVSAAIQKNKRGQGPAPAPVIDSNNFEIVQSKARTKVYSGNKGAAVVLSLHEMCIRVLQKNVDALEYTGGVPFDILEPILLKCSAAQLDQIEYYNPYLAEDTNDLWKVHVQRHCRGKKRQEMESWREMYQRCQQEEEERLSSLTMSIKHQQQISVPLKQTKMAYMDQKQAPPMGRRRGTGGGGGGGPSINASLTNRTSVNGTRMGFLTAGREVQAKRAPLMQKTLALMKKAIKR